MEKNEVAEQVANGDFVTGNFTIQATLGNGKTMTVSGYVYSKNTPESINAQVNLLHDALDFQRTRATIPELEAKLEQQIDRLKQHRDRLNEMTAAQAAVTSKLDGGGSLTSRQKKDMETNREQVTREFHALDTTIQTIVDDIKKGEEEILKSKKKIGWA